MRGDFDETRQKGRCQVTQPVGLLSRYLIHPYQDAVPRLPWIRWEVVMASLAINVLSLGLPLVILQVYDRIIPYHTTETLLLLVTGLGVALVLDIMLRLARSYMAGWASARYQHQTNLAAFKHLSKAKLRDFEKDPAGAHLERIAAINSVKDFYGSQACMTLVDLPFAVLFLCLLGYIAGVLVLAPIILLALFGTAALVVGKELRTAIENRAVWDDRRYNFMIEALEGAHSLKGLGMEDLMARRHERLQENAVGWSAKGAWANNVAQNAGAAFAQITMITIGAAGAAMVLSGQISVGALAASTLLAGRTVQPLLRALATWTRFQSVKVAEMRLNQLFALPVENPDGYVPDQKLRGAISFQDVSITDGSHRDLMRRYSMDIAPGEIIGVTGDNGSGKSVFLDLIMGTTQPDAGRILLDGHDIAELDPRWTRRQIAYLPRDGVMFRGTVLDNLTGFQTNQNIETALNLAAQLGLDSFFGGLPDGYDTFIPGSSTRTLPNGIAQRIAIVRALLNDPKIILFNEANTNFDRKGDAQLADLLGTYKGRATIILVSLRPSLLRLADRIYVLKDGRLSPYTLPATTPGSAHGPGSAQATLESA